MWTRNILRLAIAAAVLAGTSEAFALAAPQRAIARPTTQRYASIVVSNNDENLSIEETKAAKSTAAGASQERKILLQSLSSTAIFVVLNLVFKTGFAQAGVAFPSPLAGCGVLFATMLMAPQLYGALKPGATFLAKWLQVFLVPSLIQLPLAPSFATAGEAAKAAAIIGGGFFASLLLTAFSVLGVRRLMDRSCDGTDRPNCAPAINDSKPAKPFADETVKGLRSLMATFGLLSVVTAKTTLFQSMATPFATGFMLFSTIHNFVFGARFPKKVTKILHPLVTCTTLTWLSAGALAHVTGNTFRGVLRSFKTGSLSAGTAGAADLLLFLLGPAIFSLGISMYDRRKLMRENMAEVATSIGVSTISGLFGTAAMVRLLMSTATKSVALSLLSRNITSALAMVTGSMLGANIPLTVSIAIVTGLLGANFGASVLSACGVHDPVARGLAIGAASHGLGTAAIADEKDAFPFAAVAMTLVASVSAAVVSIPFCQRLLVRIALGA